MQVEKDLAIRISMDMANLKKSMKELQATVEHEFEKIEAQSKRSSKKMFTVFEQNTEKMEDSVEELEKETKQSSNKMEKAFDSINVNLSGKFSRTLRNVASLIATTFSARKVYEFGKSCVEASADLEAMEAAFKQIMSVQLDTGEIKDYTKEATNYLNKMCDEFDMDINTLKEDFTSFTSQFKGLGYGIEDAMSMSDRALRMSADASAQFNISLEDAIAHVRSFMNGNYMGGRSVQLFGSETAIKEWYEGLDKVKASSIGVKGAWDDLTDSEKQLLRLNFGEEMYKQAGITGQAARESELYLNQLTKMQQKWTNLKAAMGDAILPKVTEVFQKLNETFEKIENGNFMNRFQTFIDTIGEHAIDGLVTAFEKLVGWILKVDWGTVGMQLETIAGYIGDFLGASWDVLTEELADICNQIMDAFGVDKEATEGMDSVNAFLYRAKPMFKWLSENGETVAKAIVDIGKAWATWKTIKIGATIGGVLLQWSTAGGFASWLLGKMGVESTSVVGKTITKAVVGGAGSTIGALAIPITLAFTFEYWGSDKQKQALEKKTNDRFGTTFGAKNDSEKYMGGETVNWDEVSASWSQFWKDVDEACEGSSVNIQDNVKGLETNTSTSWQNIRNGNRETGIEWESFWSQISNSKFVTGVRNLCTNTKQSWSTWGSDIKRNWSGVKLEWNNFWNGISNSKFVTGLRTFCSNTKHSWSTWGTDIKKNWGGVKKEWSSFWKGISDSKFGQGLKGMLNGVVRVLNSGINKFLTGINYIIKGINWVYNKLTKKGNLVGEIDVKKWKIPELAKGTNNWQGGTALVGEAGRELVSDPKLGTFMADRPMILPLSQGASVLRNSKTERLLKKMGIDAYAKGKNEGFLSKIGNAIGTAWDYLTDPSKLVKKFYDLINFDLGDFILGDTLVSWAKNSLKSHVVTFFKDLFNTDEIKNSPDNPNNMFAGSGKGYETAMRWAKTALSIKGYKEGTKAYNDFIKAFQIVGKHESNYNNSAINLWDINARRGTPSAGWLQFIAPTFKSYAEKGYQNFMNGMHQALAFINYANKRYGGALKVPGVKSVMAGGKYKPYANGGLINSPTFALMGEAGTEAVVPLSNAKALKPFGQSVANALVDEGGYGSGGTYEFIIPLVVDGREIAKATATFTKEELDKLDKRNGRLNGRK